MSVPVTVFLSSLFLLKLGLLLEQQRFTSILGAAAPIQRLFEVNITIARDLQKVLNPENCYAPVQPELVKWLTEFKRLWTAAGFAVATAIQVLQKRPALRFVQVDAIIATLTQLHGKMRTHCQLAKLLVVKTTKAEHLTWLLILFTVHDQCTGVWVVMVSLLRFSRNLSGWQSTVLNCALPSLASSKWVLTMTLCVRLQTARGLFLLLITK